MTNVLGMKPGDLTLSNDEWAAIAPTLPDAPKDARRVADRLIVTALLACEASQLSVEIVAPQVGIAPQTVRTRRARWQHNGVIDQILAAGLPATERMRTAFYSRFGEAALQGARLLERLQRSWASRTA